MIDDSLAESVLGLAIEVHNNLGPGLLETVYEAALCQELAASDLTFRNQVAIPVVYKGQRLDGGFRADVVVQEELLIEIKSVETLLPLHEAQVLTYLRVGGFSRGLLINFNTRLLKDGIRRFVMRRKLRDLRASSVFSV